MDIQDLMKPRYKVIADYPTNPRKVGSIVTDDIELWKKHDDLNFIQSDFASKYPHLFKPLQWWEERKPEDMPEYVKAKDNELYVIKVAAHFTGYFYSDDGGWPYRTNSDSFIRINDKERFTESRIDHQYYDFLPATKEEYEPTLTNLK